MKDDDYKVTLPDQEDEDKNAEAAAEQQAAESYDTVEVEEKDSVAPEADAAETAQEGDAAEAAPDTDAAEAAPDIEAAAEQQAAEATPESEQPRLTPESVQAEIKRTRHKKEIPLYIICSIAGIIGVIVQMYRSAKDDGFVDQLKDMVLDVSKDTYTAAQVLKVLLGVMGFVFGVGAVIFLICVLIVNLYKIYGEQMAYSIRVSEDNFPELYAKVKEFSYLLGIKEPEVYVQQQNGIINAFTCWVPGKAFIQLNAEIVDVAYMEHKDQDVVNFVMAHEFGHIALHHVQIMYTIWSVLVMFVPVLGQFVLGPMLSRSREYSADRVGQALMEYDKQAQRDCMMLLATGRHVYKYMDADKYLENITADHNAVERIARWVINFMASHPIMPYRTKAILDPEKKSGKLL